MRQLARIAQRQCTTSDRPSPCAVPRSTYSTAVDGSGPRSRHQSGVQLRQSVNIRGAGARLQDYRRHVDAYATELRECYAQPTPSQAGHVAVQVVLSPTGAVQEAEILETTLDTDSIEMCILRGIWQSSFPMPDGGGVVRVQMQIHSASVSDQ